MDILFANFSNTNNYMDEKMNKKNIYISFDLFVCFTLGQYKPIFYSCKNWYCLDFDFWAVHHFHIDFFSNNIFWIIWTHRLKTINKLSYDFLNHKKWKKMTTSSCRNLKYLTSTLLFFVVRSHGSRVKPNEINDTNQKRKKKIIS